MNVEEYLGGEPDSVGQTWGAAREGLQGKVPLQPNSLAGANGACQVQGSWNQGCHSRSRCSSQGGPPGLTGAAAW